MGFKGVKITKACFRDVLKEDKWLPKRNYKSFKHYKTLEVHGKNDNTDLFQMSGIIKFVLVIFRTACTKHTVHMYRLVGIKNKKPELEGWSMINSTPHSATSGLYLRIYYGTCKNGTTMERCEPQRQKTYLRIYAPSDDSDQPARMRRLIRIVTGRIFDHQECSFVRMRRLIWIHVGCTCNEVHFLTLRRRCH